MRTPSISILDIAVTCTFLAIGCRQEYTGIRRAAVSFVAFLVAAMAGDLALLLLWLEPLGRTIKMIINVLPTVCTVDVGPSSHKAQGGRSRQRNVKAIATMDARALGAQLLTT